MRNVLRALAPRAAGYVVGVGLLCLPMAWNGFPVMFDDVGGYLERWPTGTLGLGRSAAYGLLLWITRAHAFIPAIWLQAVVTVFVIDCALKVFLPARPQWLLPCAVAAVAAASGAAMFASKAIPDAWAAPAVLAVHLLAWHPGELSKIERAALAAIVAFAGASHLATFGVLAGLSVLYAGAWLVRRQMDVAPSGVKLAVAAIWSGLVLLLVVDYVVAGRVAVTPGGAVFFFGSLIEDGQAREILAEECPRADWQLCSYRDELPQYAEEFIFDGNGVLRKIGGDQDPRALGELASIIKRSLIRHPFEHAMRVVNLSATQFVDVGVGDAMEPLMAAHARWTLSRYTPELVPPFDSARQQSGAVDFSAWSDWIVVPISLVAAFFLPVFALLLWSKGLRREAMLPGALFLALLWNAAICGVISHPNSRYQARLVWLAAFAIGVQALAASRGYRGREMG